MAPIIAAALPLLGDVIKRFIPDKEAALKAEQEMYAAAVNGELRELESAVQVIVSEAKAGGLAAQWRPITMLAFVAIVVNNYILSPYLQALFGFSVALDVPADMWDLIKIGLGGYVVGRSAEKVALNWKSK